MKLFITIAGNLSAGKSTLTKIVAENFNAVPVFEPFRENPYLANFYKDMKAWAFHCQMYFLSQRMRDHHFLSKKKGIVIQDRSIYEDYVFAKTAHEQGFIKTADWEIYQSFYKALMDLLPAPDLIIYLKASLPLIKERIKKRGRDFEQNINDEYLSILSKIYDEWAKSFKDIPVLTISVDNLDFEKNPKDAAYIVGRIKKKLGARSVTV